MANINDLQYRVDDIGDGNPQNGGSASFFTCVVDPNPLNNVSVPIEDLFIFVRLRAFPQSRSVITTDNKFTSRSQEDDGIYFIGRNRSNSDNGYLTTNYTNIGGVGNTGVDEGLGITNISISVNMFTPSIVEIDFIDVRGAAVFDKQENYVDGNYFNSSRYSSFFTLPYPIFELTVKGYYGKATTYYLNLIDFKATLDGERGDFSIKCKFIGYEFAFLSDIITKYVIDLNNTPVGKRLLSEYERRSDGGKGLMSIPELLQKYTQIATSVEDFKEKDVTYEKLKIINTLIDYVREISSVIGLPCTLNTDEYGRRINDDNFVSGYVFLRDIGVFGEEMSSNLDVLFSNLNNKINAYNSLIDQNIRTFPDLGGLKLQPFSFSPSKSYPDISDTLLDDVQAEISNNETNDFRSLYTVDKTNLKINASFQGYFFTSFYDIRKNIQGISSKLKDQKKADEDGIVDRLNSRFINQIGFNPTIFNVFEIIMGNIDIFLDQVYSVCKKADALGEERVGDLRSYLSENNVTSAKGSTDIPFSHNKIYPFPAVYDVEGKQVWLGDVVGETNKYYPEIDLVNTLLNSSISDQLYEDLQNNILSFGQTLGLKWVPVHPLDYTENVFSLADTFNYSDTALSDVFDALFLRLFLLSQSSLSKAVQNTEEKINIYAQLEGAFFASNILNANIKTTLQNSSSDEFANKAWDYAQNQQQRISLLYSSYLTEQLDFFTGSASTYNLIDEVPLSSLPFYNTTIQFFSNQTLASNITTVLTEKVKKDLYSVLRNNNNTFSKIDNSSYLSILDLTSSFSNLNIDSTLLSKYKAKFTDINNTTAPLISVLDDMAIIDGDLSGITLKKNYSQNAHNFIAKSVTNYNNNNILFDQFYYNTNNDEAKAFLFLSSFGFKDSKFYNNNYKTQASKLLLSDLYIAYLGGIRYQNQIQQQNGYNFLTNDIKNNPNFNLIANENVFKLKDDIADDNDFFINAFKSFVTTYKNKYEQIADTYVRLGVVKNITPEYISASDELLSLSKSYSEILVLGSKAITTKENIDYITNETKVKTYAKIFADTFKYILSSQNPTADANAVQNTQQDNLVIDKNLKISVYNHLKNIYDKWLSYNTENGKIYNFSRYLPSHPNKNQTTQKRLIDHCYFIDRTWSDIGELVVLNPKPLLAYAGQLDGNMYFFISRILKDNNFNFYNIPAYVEYSNKEEVSNIFRPYTTVENSRGGSCFVFQYVAGNSKVLDLNQSSYYLNDGFDFKSGSDGLPKGFVNRVIPNTNRYETLPVSDKTEYLNKYNLCVFRVSYADQNQNIFKEINVTQEEHRETAESMVIQDELAGGKGGTKRIYMGADLYNMYAVRSYRTDVSCLGNTQILPTMYFQLDNVPLFHGAHMITNVKHTITPHNMITEFGGRRISKFVYPIIDKITTYFNLELNSKVDDSVTNFDGDNAVSNGNDNLSYDAQQLVTAGFDSNIVNAYLDDTNISANLDSTNVNEVFRVVKPQGIIIPYILSPSVTNVTDFENRLAQVFNPNDFQSYGITGGYCAAWVREALFRLGIVKSANYTAHAWDIAAGLPERNGLVQYFTKSQKLYNWSNQDFADSNLKNGSLLFGYTRGSQYLKEGYLTIKNSGNQPRIAQLTANNRNDPNISSLSNYELSTITHIGVFYNGVFFNLRSDNKASNLIAGNDFVPVMAYHFLPTAKTIAAKR